MLSAHASPISPHLRTVVIFSRSSPSMATCPFLIPSFTPLTYPYSVLIAACMIIRILSTFS